MTRIQNAQIRANNLDEAVEFFTDVMGLQVQGRDSETVYLGCGYTDNHDLSIVSGGTGVQYLSIGVTEDELDQFKSDLEEQGVETREENSGVSHSQGVGFELPSGQSIKLVVPKDTNYVKPGYGSDMIDGHTPYNLDHVTLTSPDVKEDVEFLKNVLGFKISDIAGDPDENWVGAWTRLSPHHHEIAFIKNPPETSLHHVAWNYSSLEDIKTMADRLSRAGHELEVGPGRHAVGNNVFAYFMGPDGNRHELTTDVPDVNEGNEPGIWKNMPEALSAWGAWKEQMPDSFMNGT